MNLTRSRVAGGAKPKETSADYGRELQLHQLEKYRNRHRGGWELRIGLAQRLVEEYAIPRLGDAPPEDVSVVDIGCSIGTFAIEFAKLGYEASGIDFDPDAIAIAKRLAEEEGVSPSFVIGDVAQWAGEAIDIAVCFDLFEHLHDDELGALLGTLRRNLSPKGSVVFHTHPTGYDHVFYGPESVSPAIRRVLRLQSIAVLLPFVRIRPRRFDRLVKAEAALLDFLLVVTTGQTHRESIRRHRHCNPTTKEGLAFVFARAGFETIVIETAPLYPRRRWFERLLERQPIAHRNLYGVAIPSGTGRARDAVAR